MLDVYQKSHLDFSKFFLESGVDPISSCLLFIYFLPLFLPLFKLSPLEVSTEVKPLFLNLLSGLLL